MSEVILLLFCVLCSVWYHHKVSHVCRRRLSEFEFSDLALFPKYVGAGLHKGTKTLTNARNDPPTLPSTYPTTDHPVHSSRTRATIEVALFV